MSPDAPPPPPTIDMVGHDGQVVAVPHDQAAQAYASGALGFVKGSKVPVMGSGGTVGTVDAEHAGHVLSSGGRLATPDELRSAELDTKYGGVLHTLASAGEGAARGLSLGISDPLAVAAGKLLGGDKGGEAVRTHLEEEKEAHPYVSGGAELLGAAAPILASGGAAAPEEAASLAARGGAEALGAASEAETIGKIGAGVRRLGVLPATVGRVGNVAEHAIGSVLGSTAESTLGRAAQGAAKAAVRGIAEGGLFGAGQEISEDTIQDKDLTAEKLFASVGHGALMGGLLGGGLAGAGKLAAEGAGELLGASSPKLGEETGEQAWKWLDPLKKYSDQATKRAGGTDAVGRTVFDEVLKPLVEEKGLAAAAIGNDEKYELVQQALQKKGAAIGELVSGNSHASVPLSEMLRPIDERISEFSGKVGGEDKVAALQKLRDSVTRVLGADVEPEAVQAVRKVGGIDGANYARDGMRAESLEAERARYAGMPADEANATSGALERPVRIHVEPGEAGAADQVILNDGRHRVAAAKEAGATHILADVVHYDAEGNPLRTWRGRVPIGEGEPASVPIAKAIEQRRALQQIAYEESKSLDPKLRVQLLRDVSGEWNKLEETALNKASKMAGDGAAGTQLRALNKTYQHLKLAADALETNTSRFASNNTFSLGDKMFAASTLAGGLASAHPATALAAPAMGLAHKALRAHGNAYAALMLDRLATWGGASRAVAEFDSTVDHAVDVALSGRRAPRAFHTSAGGDSKARFEAEESRVRQLAAMSPGLVGAHLEQRTAPLQAHMPQIASAMQASGKAATAWLASKLPPTPLETHASLTPQLDRQPVSVADRTKLLRAVDAVEGGPGEIMKRVASGTVTPEDAEALQKLYPKAYDEIRTKIAAKCADRTKPLPFQAKLRLGSLFGMPTDPILTQPVIAGIQQSYDTHPNAPSSQDSGHGPAPHRSAPTSLSVSKSLASTFSSARGGA